MTDSESLEDRCFTEILGQPRLPTLTPTVLMWRAKVSQEILGSFAWSDGEPGAERYIESAYHCSFR